jgi:hypothetical protein
MIKNSYFQFLDIITFDDIPREKILGESTLSING